MSEYKWQNIISYKLEKAGAKSRHSAVTPDEANLSFAEYNWLRYLAGGMTSHIRKTTDGRYFIRT